MHTNPERAGSGVFSASAYVFAEDLSRGTYVCAVEDEKKGKEGRRGEGGDRTFLTCQRGRERKRARREKPDMEQ